MSQRRHRNHSELCLLNEQYGEKPAARTFIIRSGQLVVTPQNMAVFSRKSQKKVYRAVSSINFAMLLIATVTPLLLWYPFQDGYFLRGLWTFCDRFGCNEIFDPGAYLDAAQALSVLTNMVGLIALLSSWEMFKIFVDWDIDENITSCVTNFTTGSLLLSTLLITFFKLRTIVDINGNRLKPFCGFYIGCIACALSFTLGIYSMLQAKSVIIEEKLRIQRGGPRLGGIQHCPAV
ncbi:uncharacterized protein LOC134293713 isoform X2 [Anolis carolinensis]|uniref:uncharacterized protein LOC134293713 isoform X2 n=1 Tax=Anolis carolinensis TaxID=28377 RepID=UPI002F2B5B1C